MPDTTNTTGTNDYPTGGAGFPADKGPGEPGLTGPDDYTRWVQMQRLTRPANQTVVGGNYADLQRLGENVAGGPGTTTTLNSALVTNPNVDPKADNVVTAPQAEAARGEYTRETERAGLLNAPPPPVPPENTDPNPVDPSTQSPRAEAKGGSAKSTPTAKEK